MTLKYARICIFVARLECRRVTVTMLLSVRFFMIDVISFYG